jgi:hypothetical protein
MKTTGFLFAVCLLMSLTLSAQTNLDSKPDSAKIQIDANSNGSKFDHTNPNSPNYKNFNLNQNLALSPHQQNFVDPNFRMPVLNPDFQSNMPIMKPVHWFITIC